MGYLEEVEAGEDGDKDGHGLEHEVVVGAAALV